MAFFELTCFFSNQINFYFFYKKNLTFDNKHMFHLVDRSPWPFFMALSIFLTASGLLWWMHRINFGGYFLLIGFFSILLCMYV